MNKGKIRIILGNINCPQCELGTGLIEFIKENENVKKRKESKIREDLRKLNI